MGVQHAHVCVFGVDNDECLICGTRAALVGQQSSAQRQPGPSWKKAIYEISEQVPTSKRDWSHKPHFSRLICICVGCLVLMILLVAVTAVALSIDANECSEGQHDCSPDAYCTNLDGAFTCDCNRGYTGTGRQCKDVDECSRASTGCSPHADCVNTPGSFLCQCISGYSGDGLECADVDECRINNGNCGGSTFKRCVNQLGAPNTCEDIKECASDNGGCGNSSLIACQERDGAAPDCVDINECAVGNGGCGSGYTCINQDARQGLLHLCQDVDECADGTHGCHANANCSNFPVGSYTCTCQDGYGGNGVSCADVNECDDANGGCDMFCLNELGGHSCACASRFALRQSDGKTCDDVDECATSNGDCGPAYWFTCENKLGAPPNCMGGYPACPVSSSELYGDCDGACFTTAVDRLGDQFCDDGTNVPNLNCSQWQFDSGDC